MIFCCGGYDGKTEREKEDFGTHCRQPRGDRDPNKRQLDTTDIGRALTKYIFEGGWEPRWSSGALSTLTHRKHVYLLATELYTKNVRDTVSDATSNGDNGDQA
jgi:hypothetical protein